MKTRPFSRHRLHFQDRRFRSRWHRRSNISLAIVRLQHGWIRAGSVSLRCLSPRS